MINGQKEIWFSVPTTARDSRRVIALSNCGRAMRGNGEIFETNYLTRIKFNGKSYHVYRLIIEYFKPKTEDDMIKNRTIVDHITHNPIGIGINDIRNLRWCTQRENCNFEEIHTNLCDKKKPTTYFGKWFIENYGKPSEHKALYNRLHKRFKTTGELPC